MSGAAAGFSADVNSDLSATVRLDARIYSKEAVLKASYWHTDVAYITLSEGSENEIAVHIKLKHAAPTLANPKPTSIQDVADEFCNSVLDFELRRQVELQTAGIRQLVLAKAFSESGVLEDEPPGTVADPVELKKPSSLVKILNSPKT